ncbi:hypothetical protein [Streptomyces virginiae]
MGPHALDQGRGRLINDGAHSFRNPANHFAWPTARLAQGATALSA